MRTEVRIIDRSYTPHVDIATADNVPTMAGIFTSDKGEEGFILYQPSDYDKFLATYGAQPDFFKHGQPNLQIYATLTAGARVLARRVVSSKATLANSGLIAHLIKEQSQKTNANGDLLYLDDKGNLTTLHQAPATKDSYTICSFSLKHIPVSPTGLSVKFGNVLTATYDAAHNTFTTDGNTGVSGLKPEHIDPMKCSFNSQTGAISIGFDDAKNVPDKSTPITVTYTNGPIINTTAGVDTTHVENPDFQGVVGEIHGTVRTALSKSNENQIVIQLSNKNIKPGTVVVHIGSYKVTEDPVALSKLGAGRVCPLVGTNVISAQSSIDYNTGLVTITYTKGNIPPESVPVSVEYAWIDNKVITNEAIGTVESVYNKPKVYLPAMLHKCRIRYEVKSILTNSNDPKEVAKMFIDSINTKGSDSEVILPLWIVMAKGRGAYATTRWLITPAYQYARVVNYAKYLFTVLENGSPAEPPTYFSADVDRIEGDINTALDVALQDSTQVRCKVFSENIREMYHTIAKFTNNPDLNAYKDNDFLFGTDIKGNKDPLIEVDIENGIDPRNEFGIALQNGSDGDFVGSFIHTDIYEQEMAAALSTDDVESDVLQNYSLSDVCLIVDANYPPAVKRQFEEIVIFRQDASFLRDYGIEAKTIPEFKQIKGKSPNQNYAIQDYPIFGDIIDPTSKKQITVTLCYILAQRIVGHFVNGRNRPFTGYQYGLTFPEILPGTINFLPRLARNIDEAQEMDDNRFNYCVLVNGVYTLEGVYTSQATHTDLSYSQNVYEIQHVVQTMRKTAAELRYLVSASGHSGNANTDLYEDALNKKLSQFSNEFATFKLMWGSERGNISDNKMYAILEVSFKRFVNKERFDIICLPYVTSSSTLQ